MRWFLISDIVSSHDGRKPEEESVIKFLAQYRHKLITFNDTHGMDGTRVGIAEVELLAKCDEMIVTGGSTFGYVAVFKAGRLPYIVNGNINMAKCVKANLSHPGYRSDFNKHNNAIFESPYYRTY